MTDFDERSAAYFEWKLNKAGTRFGLDIWEAACAWQSARATPADQEPVAWALKMADGKLDMTDATERPTDSLERWSAMNSHKYVPLNAAQYAMLQEILK